MNEEFYKVKRIYCAKNPDKVYFNRGKTLNCEVVFWKIEIEETYRIKEDCPLSKLTITTKGLFGGKTIYKHTSKLDLFNKMDSKYYEALIQRFNYLIASGEMEVTTKWKRYLYMLAKSNWKLLNL